jgi:hypothetical protein
MTDIYVKYSPRNFKENRLNYEINHHTGALLCMMYNIMQTH